MALILGVIFMASGVFACAPEYDNEDIVLLARLIAAEAQGEEYAGQLAVGNVVVNRLKTGIWGDTLQDVIFYENQFAEPYESYFDDCYKAACEALLEEARAVPEYVLYFQRAKVDCFYAPWFCTIGRHNFYGGPSDYG